MSTPWRGTRKSSLGLRGSRANGRSRGHQCPPIRHLGLVSLFYSSKQNDQDCGMSIEHGERYFFTPFSETFCHVGDTMMRTNSDGWPAVARPSPPNRRSVTATST